MASGLALLFTIVLFLVSDASGRITFVDFIPSKKTLTNTSNTPVAVYTEDLSSKNVLTFLQPGLSLTHVSSISGSEWNYVILNGKIATVRSNNINITYIINESYYLTPELVDKVYWYSFWGSVLSVLGLLGLLAAFKLKAKDIATDNDADGFELDFDFKSTIDGTRYSESNNKHQSFVGEVIDVQGGSNQGSADDFLDKTTELNVEEELKKEEALKIKAEEARLARILEKEQLDQKRKQQELAAAKKEQEEARRKEAIKIKAQRAEAKKTEAKKSSQKLPEKHKKETARLRHELIRTANEESKARYRGEATIVEMKQSYDRLFEKYKSVKSEAQALGIDFDDQKYKKLLSIRGFQIYVVSSLISENKFTVLEWIPEKGYDSETSVESSVGPNLIVQDSQGNVLGLVCKYRASYYLANKVKELCWASDQQSEQYKKFSKSRNMPLYLVIGLRGKYNAPKYNFLLALDEISKHSKRVNDLEKGFQLAVNTKDISADLVKKGNYSACLDTKLNKI